MAVKIREIIKPVAAYNPRTKTIHRVDCQVHEFIHVEWIGSWASAEGRHVRRVGHACKVCKPAIVKLIGD